MRVETDSQTRCVGWPNRRTIALLGIILLAFGLRLFCLDCQSLWVDEATSAYLTTLSPTQIVLDRANNLHPPTYFVALAGWAALAGRSEFSLRFLSVCVGLLTVPLLYRLCQRLFADPRTSLLAALLAALSPASVVYAQETRMYVALLVGYILVLTCALSPGGLRSRRDWVWFALGELLCLYLHFFSLFIVFAINLLLLATWLRRASHRTWRRWITSQTLVALAYVPWLLAMWRWGTEVPGKLSRRAWQATELRLPRFLSVLWEFLNSGLVDIGRNEVLGRLLEGLGGLVLVAVLLALAFDRRRKTLLVVSGALFLPLAAALPVWFMRPLSHPRYLLFLLAPLLVVLARALAVLSRRSRGRMAGIVVVGAVVSGQFFALRHVFFDARFYRFDMRALARAIADRAVPGEAVVMPPSDYSLWYYDPAPAAPVNLPGESGAEGGRLRPPELGPLLKDRPGAFLVTYRDLRTVDPRGQIPFLLETNGRLIDRFSVDRMDVDHYALEPEWRLPELTAMEVPVGPLMLTGVYTQAITSADNAVTVALSWQLVEPVGDLKAVVRLWDEGQQIASADVRVLNELGRPTSWWPVGDEGENYYVLPLPMGTAPLTYTLSVGVYEVAGGNHLTWESGEEWLALGSVRLRQAVGQTADPYGSWNRAQWRAPDVQSVAEGLLLEGYVTTPQVLRPGDTLKVALRWRALEDGLSVYAPRLLLRQDGIIKAEDSGSLFDRYPTSRWAADQLLIETRQLSVPPSLEAMQLVLELDGRLIPLEEVAVTREALQWEVPASAQPLCARLGGVAELAGYDWAPAASQPGAWQLTLYWRALEGAPGEESYSVFTHLLGSDSALIAQHDGFPQGGRRVTTTWIPGEVIVDRHRLVASGVYSGPARLLVGMYNLASMDRLPVMNCAGQALPADAVPVLEVVLNHPPELP